MESLQRKRMSDKTKNIIISAIILYLFLSNFNKKSFKQTFSSSDKIIRKIAEEGSCVIVGRAADYVLRDNKDVLRIFIHAPKEYRIKNIMSMYNDSESDAKKNILKSDKARAKYYETVASKKWNSIDNYDLIINSSIGPEKSAEVIIDYINNLK